MEWKWNCSASEFRTREAAEMSRYAADFPEVLEFREELNAMLQLEDELGV